MIFGEGPIIKNIAGDLNKLFLQGTRAGQPITNVEGDAAADQGTTDLLAAMDPVIQEVAVGMSGEESRHYTVSGVPPLAITNSLGKPLASWSVELLPYQNLNGYDAPWPAGGGENLLTLNDGTYNYPSQVVTAIVSNETITVNGTATGSGGINTKLSNDFMLKAGTYYIKRYGDTTIYPYINNSATNESINTGVDRTFTLADDTLVYFGINVINGTVYDNASIKIVVKSGNTAPTEWTPYSNVCPIYGTDKLNIFVEESYDQSAAPKAVITVPQTVYTATIGSDGGESITRYRLYNGDSSEDWKYSEAWSKTNTAVFYSNVPLTDAMFSDYAVTYITNCNLLPPKSRQLLYDYDTQGIAYSGSYTPASHYLTVRIPKTIASTVEEFTAFLASNPLEVVYMLTDPDQFTLTAPDIPTPTGTATTWATAEDGVVDSMEVTYVGKA